MDIIWQTRHSPVGTGGWRDWLAMGVALLVRDMLALYRQWDTWQERARQRQSLARLDDRALADIGLSRADVAAETCKPFWQA